MILVTGANGHLGRRLVATLCERGVPVRAVVRSRAAAERLGVPRADLDVRVLDYLDQAAVSEAARGCSTIVHLVGILKESAHSRYPEAHEATSRVVAEAARIAGARRIVYLSIVGSAPGARNPCLASKGNAEQILLGAPVPALILRVPMVLGEQDFASEALKRRASKRLNVLLRADSLEQPIYAGDVVAAIVAGLGLEGGARAVDLDNTVLELAGPESLTRRALVLRAAAVCGHTTRVVSLPLSLGLLLARVLERCLANPPVTRAMLGVLDHDDRLDPAPAAARLGIALTDLDTTLTRVLRAPGGGSG